MRTTPQREIHPLRRTALDCWHCIRESSSTTDGPLATNPTKDTAAWRTVSLSPHVFGADIQPNEKRGTNLLSLRHTEALQRNPSCPWTTATSWGTGFKPTHDAPPAAMAPLTLIATGCACKWNCGHLTCTGTFTHICEQIGTEKPAGERWSPGGTASA